MYIYIYIYVYMYTLYIVCLVRMECPALCPGGREPLIAGCLPLLFLSQRVRVDRTVHEPPLRVGQFAQPLLKQGAYPSREVVIIICAPDASESQQ